VAIIPESLHTYSDHVGIRLTEEALFRDLSAATRRKLSEISHSETFELGQLVFSEGDVPSDVKILVEGQAILVAGNATTDSLGVRKAANGEIFGLTETLGHSPYRYSLKGLTDCRFDTIAKEDLETFLSNEKLPRFRLIRILGIAVQTRHLFARSL
jgi:CRP-like cAMP-binding protein